MAPRRSATPAPGKAAKSTESSEIPRRRGRNYVVYDGVARRIGVRGYRPGRMGMEKHRQDFPPLAPQEILFRRRSTPQRPKNRDPYWANRDLQPSIVLPSSDLLKGTHTYATDFYSSAFGREGKASLRSMNGSALLAFGILAEEAAKDIIGKTGYKALLQQKPRPKPGPRVRFAGPTTGPAPTYVIRSGRAPAARLSTPPQASAPNIDIEGATPSSNERYKKRRRLNQPEHGPLLMSASSKNGRQNRQSQSRLLTRQVEDNQAAQSRSRVTRKGKEPIRPVQTEHSRASKKEEAKYQDGEHAWRLASKVNLEEPHTPSLKKSEPPRKKRIPGFN